MTTEALDLDAIHRDLDEKQHLVLTLGGVDSLDMAADLILTAEQLAAEVEALRAQLRTR